MRDYIRGVRADKWGVGKSWEKCERKLRSEREKVERKKEEKLEGKGVLDLKSKR